MTRLSFRRSRSRWLLGIGLCTLVATVASAANLSGLPPVAGATVQVALDLPRGSVLQDRINADELASLTSRTLLLSELISAPPVLSDIAHRAHLPPATVYSATSYIQNIPEQMLGPDLEVRGMQIIGLRAPYQLDIQPDPNLPRFEIYARAPTIPAAAQLADAVVPGLLDYLRADAVSHGVDPAKQIRVQELGVAQASLLASHAKYEIAGLTWLIAFGLCAALLVCLGRVRAGWRLAAQGHSTGAVSLDGADRPRKPLLSFPGRRMLLGPRRVVGHPDPAHAHPGDADTRRRAAPRPVARRQAGEGQARANRRDDWPHTTRVMPWLIAAFMVVLWLVPFDSIQLAGSSLPIDLKFDRIVLPIIVVFWVLALVAGGRAAPRLRASAVHVGVLGFLALACLTFALNARYLDQTLQIDRGVKQLMLLCAYVTFFLITASIVKRTEVPAFLRFTLVLAVIAGIGTIIEYRFQYNVFYDLAHRLLPGFQVGTATSSGIDNIGRRLVEGPAEVPLEAVGMFTLALPIALLGLMDARQWRQRIVYGLATAILVAAAVSTERKSGLLGPCGVLVALAYFRRRQMVRLVPLALILLVLVKVLVPGGIGGTASQLAPSHLGVSTVDERVVRWDAIRPDVWLHLAVGQGYGVYSIRVLDNEYLDRLIEGGILGLTAYVAMLLSLVLPALGRIRRREPVTATIAIIVASAAVGTLVLSATYDSMGFPHVPYILFSMGGLLAVALGPPRSTEDVASRLLGRRREAQALRRDLQPAVERAWSS